MRKLIEWILLSAFVVGIIVVAIFYMWLGFKILGIILKTAIIVGLILFILIELWKWWKHG